MRSAGGNQGHLAIRLALVTRRIVLAAAVLALAAAPTAKAATWKQLTSDGGANIDQVALLRTSDGVLHVVWHKRTGPNTEDLLHTVIGANGKVGATTPVQSGWTGFGNAGLTTIPGGGIRAFWGGIRTIDPNETNQDENMAVSTDGGASWALTPGSVVQRGTQAYGSSVSATTRPDGTPMITYAGTLGTWVHAGADATLPNFDLQAPLGTYGYDPNIASDASGTMVAWYSNATGHLGPHAQAVNPDGSPIGSAMQMPGTANMDVGMIARTPLVARPGGGFYVAYPTGYPTQNSVRVWKVGTSRTTLLDRTQFNSLAAISADRSGRLWVAWKDGTRVLASRSNKAATKWGAIVDAGQPKKAGSLYTLDASATPGGGADLFGNYGIGTNSTTSTFYTRINPGLTLTANRRGSGYGFVVTDAGSPVKGAKVKGAGKSATTDSKGRARLSVKRKTKVTASASGYSPASVKLK
jgi:hypothetical protein